MNQFSQTPLKGAIAALLNPTTMSVQLDPASGEDFIQTGAGVKLVDATGSQIIVDKAAADDVAFGYVIYTPKTQKFYPGDTFEIGCAFTVMWVEASGTVSRGDQLEYVPTGDKMKTNAGNAVSGLALDNAANGGLFRAFILNAEVVPADIVGGSINDTPIGGSTPSTGVFTNLTATGNTTLGDGAGDLTTVVGILDLTGAVLKGASPLVFEGSTADAFEVTLAIGDPAADVTITLPAPAAAASISLASQAVLAAGATPSFAPGPGISGYTLTPGEDETINGVTTGAVAGKLYALRVLTSGTDSRTLTFGTNFKTTGTLATGTSDGKYFMMLFYFDGTNFIEVSRTTAM